MNTYHQLWKPTADTFLSHKASTSSSGSGSGIGSHAQSHVCCKSQVKDNSKDYMDTFVIVIFDTCAPECDVCVKNNV